MTTRQHPEFDPSPSQLLINGGFRINQRAGNPYTGSSGFTFDLWEIIGGTVSVDESTDALYGSTACLLEDTDSSNKAGLQQSIEDVQQLQGQTVTVGVWVKEGSTSPASQAEVVIEDNDGTNTTSSSETVALDGTYDENFVVVTHTVQADATSLVVKLFPATLAGDGSSTGEAIFDGVALTVGPEPVDYPQVVRPIGMEQSLCERYYEVNDQSTTNRSSYIVGGSGSIMSSKDHGGFKTKKSAVPTMSFIIDQLADVEGHDGASTVSGDDTSNWSIGGTGATLDQWAVRLERNNGIDGSEVIKNLKLSHEAEVT